MSGDRSLLKSAMTPNSDSTAPSAPATTVTAMIKKTVLSSS